MHGLRVATANYPNKRNGIIDAYVTIILGCLFMCGVTMGRVKGGYVSVKKTYGV